MSAPAVWELVPETAANVYHRLPWRTWQDVSARRTYRIVLECWHEGEDEGGYYWALDGEEVWPMTYRTHTWAHCVAQAWLADGYPEHRVRVEQVEDPSSIPVSQLRRLLERVARRAARAARRAK